MDALIENLKFTLLLLGPPRVRPARRLLPGAERLRIEELDKICQQLLPVQQGHSRTERRVHPARSARSTVSALPRLCLDRSAEDSRAAATHAARASPPAAGGIARPPPPPEIRTKPAPQAGNPLHALNLMRLNTNPLSKADQAQECRDPSRVNHN